MVKTRTWVIIIVLLLAVSLGLTLWLWSRPRGDVVNIYQDGELVRTIDLSLVTKEESFDLESDYGRNTILLEPGRIRVSDADCPDKVCVDSGWLTGAAPIVCLPHRLVIEFAGGRGNIDAVTG